MIEVGARPEDKRWDLILYTRHSSQISLERTLQSNTIYILCISNLIRRNKKLRQGFEDSGICTRGIIYPKLLQLPFRGRNFKTQFLQCKRFVIFDPLVQSVFSN